VVHYTCGLQQRLSNVHGGNGLDLDGHEFALTPQGTALVTIFHGVPFDLSSIGGPKDGIVVDGIVQEIDVATGRVLFEWHSLDHVPLDESYLPVSLNPDSYDYFHINAVNLDSDGDLLISGRHTSTVYKVDRQTGGFSGASAASTPTSRWGRASDSPGSTTHFPPERTRSGSSTTRTTDSPADASCRSRASSGSTLMSPR
jgi:hypothetical protein